VRTDDDARDGACSKRLGYGRELMTLSIEDTGLGDHTAIDDGDRRRIFVACLSAGRELARLLGGELSMTGTPVPGDAFTISLPPNRPRRAAIGAIIASAPVAPGHRPPRAHAGALPDASLRVGRRRDPAEDRLQAANTLVVDDDPGMSFR